MYGGFQGGPQLGPPDAERRQSLGQQMFKNSILNRRGPATHQHVQLARVFLELLGELKDVGGFAKVQLVKKNFLSIKKKPYYI